MIMTRVERRTDTLEGEGAGYTWNKKVNALFPIQGVELEIPDAGDRLGKAQGKGSR